MTRIEKRGGFEILLEEPPSAMSLWAALVTTGDPILFAELEDSVQVCLAGRPRLYRQGYLAPVGAGVMKEGCDGYPGYHHQRNRVDLLCGRRANAHLREARPLPLPRRLQRTGVLDRRLDAFRWVNGGGPRIKATIPVASLVTEPNFKHFFVVPIVEKEGAPALGEWLKFDSGVEAARAGELSAGDHRGVVVLAMQMYDEEDESFYEPISVLGDVPEEPLGQLV